ncbi:MAG: hypothetical protein AB7E95_09185 [Kiritimatiellales bacterium]
MKTLSALLIILSVINICYGAETADTVLLPKDAVIQGTILNYNNDHLGNWRQCEDLIRFNIPQLDKGKYKVIIKYAAPDDRGGRVSIKLNDCEFKKTFGGTGGWGAPYKENIGYYKHSGGAVDITLQILDPNTKWEAVIDIYSITLEKR